MTRDEIIRMAREVGMQGMLTDVVTTLDELEKFAALIVAAEREACAKVADEHWVFGMSSAYMADAIRARGGDA